MSYQQKEGDIAIFKVNQKKNEKGPDWTGKALINGEEKDVSLWIKSDGMLAGTIKPKYVPNYSEVKEVIKATPPIDNLSDEIPW